MAQRAELEAMLIVGEGGSALQVCVVDDARLAWMHDGGRRKDPFGPEYRDVATACAAARLLNERSFGSAS